MERNKVALIILDGWGHGRKDSSNAIHLANTPYTDSLYEHYPNAELQTSGKEVGLPHGQMGNSEVGHLNIGAGRIVYQELLRIYNAIDNGDLAKNQVLLNGLKYAKHNKKKVHLLGLVSDGGVHSHQAHLNALLDVAIENGLEDVFVHAFLDGRDCDPHSGKGFIEELERKCLETGFSISSIIGRYYAMDRDQRWERVKKAYDLLTKGIGSTHSDPLEAIRESYNKGISDEFVEPIKIGDPSKGNIDAGDLVIFFNFRTDRGRQLTRVLSQEDMPGQGMQTIDLEFITMTPYDEQFRNIEVLFDKMDLQETLGEILEKEGIKQVRAAETEKYPHVTFFFSGGREKPFVGESRILVNSPKVATYDLQPEMSAPELTERILECIDDEPGFICLNFANSDMVGHTGVVSAAIKAVETVDACLQRIVQKGLKHGFTFLITADHGNSDYIVNEDGSPNTAHTTNPVPVWLVSKNKGNAISDGRLGDLAPTILELLELPASRLMDGQSLLTKAE